uniref:Uncharacterized protein n=1 Tax=Rhizophora mucronata TaxID=61149 RepID=A0A2P2LSN7_RHIMU
MGPLVKDRDGNIVRSVLAGIACP